MGRKSAIGFGLINKVSPRNHWEGWRPRPGQASTRLGGGDVAWPLRRQRFMPGARTAWHSHPEGQLLMVTEGKGWVQEKGILMRGIKVGDVV